MYSKTEEENFEPPKYSVEPLTLRPPVGPETKGDLGVRIHTFFHPTSSRKRLFFISTLTLVFALLLILSVLFVWAMIASDGVLPWSSTVHASHTCELDVPALGLRVSEEILNPNDRTQRGFCVNLKPTTKFLKMVFLSSTAHLCKEGLTVIRAGPHCFVRPMDEQWRRLCSVRYDIQLKNGGSHLPRTVDPLVSDARWFVRPIVSIPELTRYPPLSSMCSGAVLFRLESRPPMDLYVIDALSEPDETEENLGGYDPLQTFGSYLDQNNWIESVSPRRHRRSALAAILKKNPQPLTPIHCKELTQVLEALPIPTASQGKQITLIRDKLISCPTTEHKPSSA